MSPDGLGPTVLDSASVGDETTFLPFATLGSHLDALPPAPRDVGRVRLLVAREQEGRRIAHARVVLTIAGGMPGDAWARRSPAKPEAQLAVMQHGVATLIANGQPLALFGDNLFLDLDLSLANLPIGSHVRAGAVLLEVTPKAHNGCHKFRGRFGTDALRFVSEPERRHRNLRGIYLRVVEEGEVAVGDPVHVVSRAPLHAETV
jgi:MOSC domain-containing protein YiiM